MEPDLNKTKFQWFGLTLLCTILLMACATGKKEYESGMQLGEEGKYQAAITSLEQAIDKEPKNEEYKQALIELKDRRTKELVRQAEKELRSEPRITITAINKSEVKLAEAEKINPHHPAVFGFRETLREAEEVLLANVTKLYSEAITQTQQKEWLKAYDGFQQIQDIYPGFDDSVRLMTQAAEQGALGLYKEGKVLFDKEDYKESAKYFRRALKLQADHQPSQEYLALALKRDTKAYFINQGEKAVQDQNWNQAEKAYRRALNYDTGDQSVKQALSNIKHKAAFYYMRESRAHMYAGWLFKAFESFETALLYAKNAEHKELETHLISLAKELTTQAGSWAERFKEDGNYGSAWFWYEKIKTVDPDYPDVFYFIYAMEEEILQRLKKTIAVFDFGSPSNAPDAGMIFANSLGTFLFKSADKDIKILERGNLQTILEVLKQGQKDLTSAKTTEEMSRVYGIDVAVMGSVLRYNVDTTSYSDIKTATYQVKKTEENIEYLNWKARNPNPTKEQLEQAPAPFIHNLVDVEKEYKVSTHKKVAFVTVTFRIMDVNTGEDILIDTLLRSKTVIDGTSAGVEKAGIKFDPLEIATDTELLQELTQEVVSELGNKSLEPMKDLEKTYFETGEKHLLRHDKIMAAESFANAIFNTKLKQLQKSPISVKSIKKLEDIFRNYKFNQSNKVNG